MTRKYTKRAAKWFSKEEPKAKRKYTKRAKATPYQEIRDQYLTKDEQRAKAEGLSRAGYEQEAIVVLRDIRDVLATLASTVLVIQKQDAQLVVSAQPERRQSVRIKVTPDMAPEDIGERIRDEAELRYEPDPDAAHA